MKYSDGKFDKVSAKLTLGLADPENPSTEVTLAEGDKITKIVIAAGNYGSITDETLEDVTVVGFTPKARVIDRPYSRGFDGVSINQSSTTGDHRYQLVQKACEVRDIVVSVDVDGAEGYSRRILVSKVKELQVGLGGEEPGDVPGTIDPNNG